MSNPTTPAVARPRCVSNVFAPGGMQWVPVPVGLDGAARDVWTAILRTTRAGTTCTAPDRVLAGLVGRCARYVQLGLAALERSGMIERLRRHGGRIITVIARMAGRQMGDNRATNGRHSSSSTDSQGPRQSVSQSPAPPIRTGHPSPSYEGIKGEKTPAPTGTAAMPAGAREPETPPSPWTARLFGHLPDVRAFLDGLAPPT